MIKFNGEDISKDKIGQSLYLMLPKASQIVNTKKKFLNEIISATVVNTKVITKQKNKNKNKNFTADTEKFVLV